jgi:UDP-glucose 4-epimerase
VEANLAASRSDAGGSINVGTGTESSVLDLLDALRELVPDAALDPEFAPPRLGEIERSALDVSLAERVLGWRAQTGLREGLERTLAAAAPA